MQETLNCKPLRSGSASAFERQSPACGLQELTDILVPANSLRSALRFSIKLEDAHIRARSNY